jgi:hypothetical protein
VAALLDLPRADLLTPTYGLPAIRWGAAA